jgi:hypothetical protein
MFMPEEGLKPTIPQVDATTIAPTLPPYQPQFVGRELELEYYRTLLEKDGFAIIRGMPGSGKSALAAQLLASYPISRKFWWTLYPCLNDKIQEGIWDVAQFLAQAGNPIPWNFLQAELQLKNNYPLKVKLGNIIHHLEQEPTLICIDNFHLVEARSATNSFVEWLYDRIQLGPGQVKLLIVSRTLPSFPTKRYYQPLAGLSLEETRQFCTTFGLTFDVKQAYQLTEGNPYFLELLKTETTMTDATPLPASVTDYIIQHCYRELSGDEKKLLGLIANLEAPVPYHELWEKIAIDTNHISNLGGLVFNLINKHLLKRQDIDKDFILSLHPFMRSFYNRPVSA